jgi:polyferredoxin
MSLDVKKLVADEKRDELRTAECILCGECISTCPKKVLNYKITNK